MRRGLRALGGGPLAVGLLVAMLLGVSAWRREAAVVRQRAAAGPASAAAALNAQLSTADACWVAIAWYHSGEGRAGRAPLVECDGPLVVVPGGARLEGVRTQSALLKGQIRHALCLVRSPAWEVLGEAWHYDDCTRLPATGEAKGAEAVRALHQAEVGAAVRETRARVVEALGRSEKAPAACPPGLPAAGEQLVELDATRLEVDAEVSRAAVPHEPRWRACDRPDGGAGEAAELARRFCTRAPQWTHALVYRVAVVDPVVHGDTFSGGLMSGDVAVVDLAAREVLCAVPVRVTLEGAVAARRGLEAAEVRERFLETARRGLEAARARALGR